MKRILFVLFAFLFALLLTACAQAADTQPVPSPSPAPTASPEPTAAPSVALPNPVVEVEDSTDFFDLGFMITPHQQATDVHYSIIDNTIAQIVFSLDRDTFTYRAAISNNDISGVYESFDPLPQSLDLEGAGFKVSVLIRMIDGGDNGALAQWSFEDVRYSFYTADPTDYEALTDVLLPIIYYDLPFATCCG
ncbi:MAG: hypothetical protein R2912_10125 [Eubacteriales bacterium]